MATLGVVAAPEPVDAWAFTDVITRLRRVLRTAVRSDYPWETLPMAQVELLQRLAEEPQLRVRDLAERHNLAANTVSNLIQQMVMSGLVTRTPDATDRRAVSVALTHQGERALAGWLAAHERRLEAALADLSPADRRKITAAVPALSRLVERLDAGGPGEPDPRRDHA